MLCPNCKRTHKHKVLDTISKINDCTIRPCQCLECGFLFTTVEYHVDGQAGKDLFMEYVYPSIQRFRKRETLEA